MMQCKYSSKQKIKSTVWLVKRRKYLIKTLAKISGIVNKDKWEPKVCSWKGLKITDENCTHLRCNQLKALLRLIKIRTGLFYNQILGNSQRTEISILYKVFQKIENKKIFLNLFNSSIALQVKCGKRKLETFSLKLEIGKECSLSVSVVIAMTCTLTQEKDKGNKIVITYKWYVIVYIENSREHMNVIL